MKNHHRHNRKQLRDDIRFVRKVGQIMLQWEQQHASEIDQRTFLLKPEAQERFETIQQHIQNAKIPPLSFWYGFDPMYNQLNITIEEYVFSDYSYPLHEILRTADAYSMDVLEDGRIVLSMSIRNAAYEMEA